MTTETAPADTRASTTGTPGPESAPTAGAVITEITDPAYAAAAEAIRLAYDIADHLGQSLVVTVGSGRVQWWLDEIDGDTAYVTLPGTSPQPVQLDRLRVAPHHLVWLLGRAKTALLAPETASEPALSAAA